MTNTNIQNLSSFLEQEVTLEGWVDNFRSSGKIFFLQFRDGTGYVQVVFSKSEVTDAEWDALQSSALEQAVRLTGKAVKDVRAPSGVEVQGKTFVRVSESPDYPIAKKAHGTDFLLDKRHLWLRSKR